jgi:hypothetical protein
MITHGKSHEKSPWYSVPGDFPSAGQRISSAEQEHVRTCLGERE